MKNALGKQEDLQLYNDKGDTTWKLVSILNSYFKEKTIQMEEV